MSRRRKTAPTVAVIYCRVSALDSQSESDASLEQQERTLRAMAEAHGYTELVVIRERHTASKAQPLLVEALEALDAGTYAALYAAKIDRLSRKGAADVLTIADRAETYGWRLVVADVAMDTATTVGRLVLTILAGVAEMESRRRTERMAEYHAARRARGQVAGVHYGPRNTAPAEDAEPIVAAWIAGESYAGIARRLTEEQGRPWHATQVRRIVRAHSLQPLDLAA